MNGMNQFTRRILFLLFFLSGFSSLAYQVVWTRMAFASFGIITPVLSVVLSVFMLGLSAGSWAGGRWISGLVRKTGCSAIVFYAFAELLIGVSAFAVPKLFALGEQVLLAAGQTDSFRYLSLSALVLAVVILPWCICMGTTFPFVMAYIRERDRDDTRSFSFLYLANVLGAMSGTFLTAIVLVELLGFRHTLWLAATGNFLIALAAGGLAWGRRGMMPLPPLTETEPAPSGTISSLPSAVRRHSIRWILFSTGFCAMAMEVVWTRAFTPVLKTQVYSFALIVFTYLGATFVGSWWYRRNLRDGSPCPTAKLMALLVVVVFLPILVNDHRFLNMNVRFSIHPASAIFLLASICPLCAVLGYLTPGLIDEYAAGHPAIAGRAYAINVLGCILGPLFASYVLLPCISERLALILLGLPFLGFYFLVSKSLSVWQREWAGRAVVVILACTLFVSEDYQKCISGLIPHMEARRDYAASVISVGDGMNKVLLVNGLGMTTLTPITKFMAHLPLAFHEGPPQSVLIICFGMGTTYRSALSWNIDTTAVELVPSVPKAFGFFYADAAEVLANPKGQIVIDDGRRFLMRTREKYDVIVIDPPPPMETAGSSLLYSTEFYELARQHLKPHGILQGWIPDADSSTVQASVRSMRESFPYVRCFGSVERHGIHMLASMEPIEQRTAAELAVRMPAGAKKDLLEWNSSSDLSVYLNLVTSNEVASNKDLNSNPEIRITDDQPYNEYFLLRQAGLDWR